jgi:hypothetical protein
MNQSLMRVSVIVTVLVNIMLTSTIFYLDRRASVIGVLLVNVVLLGSILYQDNTIAPSDDLQLPIKHW